MRELMLLPISITSAACSVCVPSRHSYRCPNSLLCRDCIGISVSNVESIVKTLRQQIWKHNGTASQRRKFLVAKLKENLTTTDEGSELPIIHYYLNGFKVCKSYFRVSSLLLYELTSNQQYKIRVHVVYQQSALTQLCWKPRMGIFLIQNLVLIKQQMTSGQRMVKTMFVLFWISSLKASINYFALI